MCNIFDTKSLRIQAKMPFTEISVNDRNKGGISEITRSSFFTENSHLLAVNVRNWWKPKVFKLEAFMIAILEPLQRVPSVIDEQLRGNYNTCG